jgi:3-deoxy-7-phosphoheptulonate synthase
VGWKGLINDPRLDDSFRIEEGLCLARQFLLQVAELGLPAGTEVLDPIVPQYIGDLISWTAIGARTSESQTHREIASGLSSPVGFKNGTDGNIDLAVNAIRSARSAHHFLGITQDGRIAVFRTGGNQYAHLILRGGVRPNYDRANVAYCQEKLRGQGLAMNIMIDCSHGNSERNPEKQVDVFRNGVQQIADGNDSIIGFMLESNLEGGCQPIPKDISQLRPGVSITDACLGWAATEALVGQGRDALGNVLPGRSARGGGKP